MRERKQYPNLSDEELDKRAEEALRRILNAPPTPSKAQNTQNKRRHTRRPAK